MELRLIWRAGPTYKIIAGWAGGADMIEFQFVRGSALKISPPTPLALCVCCTCCKFEIVHFCACGKRKSTFEVYYISSLNWLGLHNAIQLLCLRLLPEIGKTVSGHTVFNVFHDIRVDLLETFFNWSASFDLQQVFTSVQRNTNYNLTKAVHYLTYYRV